MKAGVLGFAALSLLGGMAFSQPSAANSVQAASQGLSTANPLGVNGARLGMTFQAWKALPPEAGSMSNVTASCADHPRPSGLVRPVVLSPSPGDLICSYVAIYGQTVLQQSFPLTTAYLARRPAYAFVDGRLSQIQFHASINAFSDLDALATARFGAPVRTLRDTVDMGHGLKVARVRREWRHARQDVWIVDPSERLDQLLVRYGVAGAAPPLPQS